jgi:hypothetical protein
MCYKGKVNHNRWHCSVKLEGKADNSGNLAQCTLRNEWGTKREWFTTIGISPFLSSTEDIACFTPREILSTAERRLRVAKHSTLIAQIDCIQSCRRETTGPVKWPRSVCKYCVTRKRTLNNTSQCICVSMVISGIFYFDPRVTALARPRSNCTSKLHTRPLVREGTTK